MTITTITITIITITIITITITIITILIILFLIGFLSLDASISFSSGLFVYLFIHLFMCFDKSMAF